MAIQDDITIDVVNKKITYTGGFTDDRPNSIYTVNALYSFLQDTFDEPGFMQHSIPMTAQTPTQYSLINIWFMDPETMKALYGGSIQTTDWTKNGSVGITAMRFDSGSADAPTSGDLGVTVTGGTSTATGVLLFVDVSPSQNGTASRDVAWVRNSSAAQFQDTENITGTGVVWDNEGNTGFQSGENIWVNLFSVGSKSATTEVYVGQEDDYMGGRAFHDGALTSADILDRRVEKIDEWWDTDVDFASGSPNLLGGVDHFDILMLTQEAGRLIDSGDLFVGARQFGTIYSNFRLTASTAGNFVVPFASTGNDLNSAEGPYNSTFTGRSGNDLEVGDILVNDGAPAGRLRAVVTAVTGGASATGNFDYYLIGENEDLATTDRTLNQLTAAEVLDVRGDTTTFTVGTVTEVTNGPAQAQGITITFANAQRDVNEDSTDEEYSCVIDCNNVVLQDVYQYIQFLTSRGNQDGSTPDTQDTLIPLTNVAVDEAGEFYRSVGDITVPWNSRTGTAPAEGVLVTNANTSWTASGIVVSLSDPTGSTGQLTLTQVKGTWANSDTVAIAGNHATNFVTINGSPSSITANTGAPFGSFAGGRWFVTRGVVLDNVPTSDANNWQTVDLSGSIVTPPTQRAITFAGLVANDRASLFEVNVAGTDQITKAQNGVGAAGASAGDSAIPLDSNVALDVPATDSWVRVVDTSSATGEEYRFYFTSVTTLTVTLDSGANTAGTATSLGSGTVLNDTGAFTAYGANASVRTGMEIRNTTDGSRAVVLRKIDNDSIETTPLSGGTDDTWSSSDVWDANRVVVALVDADTIYFPYIDDESTGSSLTALIKYVSDTDLIARMRFSDPDVGGTRILPFQQLSISLIDADLTVTAIRTADSIATP